MFDTCFLGNCKWGITIHGISISLLFPFSWYSHELLLFSGINYDGYPHMECCMVTSSYHWLLYSIFYGVLVLKVLHTWYILYPCSHRTGSTLRICFSYSNKHTIVAILSLPYNIPYIVFLIRNWESSNDMNLVNIQCWSLSPYLMSTLL